MSTDPSNPAGGSLSIPAVVPPPESTGPGTVSPPPPPDPTDGDSGGVRDPGREGDAFAAGPPRVGDVVGGMRVVAVRPATRFLELGHPRSSAGSPASFYTEGQALTARSRDRTYSCHVVSIDGALALTEDGSDGRRFDGMAFLYEGDFQRGIWLENRFLEPGQIDFVDNWVIDIRAGKIVAVMSGRGSERVLSAPMDLPEEIQWKGHAYATEAGGYLVRLYGGEQPPKSPSNWSSIIGNLSALYNATTGIIHSPETDHFLETSIDFNWNGVAPILETKNIGTTTTHTLRWAPDVFLALTLTPSSRSGGLATSYKYQIGGAQSGGGITNLNAFLHIREEFLKTASFETRPAAVREHVNPKKSVAVLEQAQLADIATTRFTDTANIRTFSNLGDADATGKLSRVGVTTWADLLQLVKLGLSRAPAGTSLEFEIDEKEMDSLYIPASVLRNLNQLAVDSKNKSISLIVRGHQILPPTVYRFSERGITTSQHAIDNDAIAFWKTPAVSEIVRSYLDQHPAQRALYNALMDANVQLAATGNEDLNDFLQYTITEVNHSDVSESHIPLDQRTLIYDRMDELAAGLRSAVQSLSINNIPTAAFAWDPITTIRRSYKRQDTPDNVTVSDGFGQMGSILEFPRRQMDIGEKRLDYLLLGLEKSRHLRAEVNGPGTNERGLKGTPPNPTGRAKVGVYSDAVAAELLLTHQPEVIFENKKAKDLVLDVEFMRILKVFHPALATPVKAVDDDGHLPYLEAYKKLEAIDPLLAQRFTVLGGFFAAPWILQGRKVDMTAAAETQEAVDRVGRVLSPTAPDKRGRADWKYLNLKLIPSREVAAALNMGGSLKNPYTYRSSRIVFATALAISPEDKLTRSNIATTTLAHEKRANIDRTEEATARYTPYYDLTTDHLWASKGLKADLENCPPQEAVPFIDKGEDLWSHLGDWNTGIFSRYLQTFVDKSVSLETRNARDGFIDESIWHAYYVTKLAVLWRSDFYASPEPILQEWRNYPVYRELQEIKYDGTKTVAQVLEERLLETAKKLTFRGGQLTLPKFTTFKDFHTQFYPEAWTNDPASGRYGAQEGRNGIGPLIAFADKNDITLTEELYQAHELYNPGEPTHYRDEVSRPYPNAPTLEVVTKALEEGGWGIRGEARRVATDQGGAVQLHSRWGLPKLWVRALSKLTTASLEFFKKDDEDDEPTSPSTLTSAGLLQSLAAFSALLAPIQASEGGIPEVTRRLLVIKHRIAELQELVRQNHISPERMTDLYRQFERAMQHASQLFGSNKSSTAILSSLRKVSQRLYRSQLAIQGDLRERLDLGEGPNGGSNDGSNGGATGPIMAAVPDETTVPATGRLDLSSVSESPARASRTAAYRKPGAKYRATSGHYSVRSVAGRPGMSSAMRFARAGRG